MGECLYSWGIEEIANKDTLDSRGHERIQFKPCNSRKCYLTAEYRSICLQNLKGVVQEKLPGVSHADLEPTRTKKINKARRMLSTYYKRHG